MKNQSIIKFGGALVLIADCITAVDLQWFTTDIDAGFNRRINSNRSRSTRPKYNRINDIERLDFWPDDDKD